MRHYYLLYGYARVSSTGQSLEVQKEQLAAFGCEIIRSEKKSGISTQGRDELKFLLEFIREGDALVVTRLDRLARSMYDLQKIMRTLGERGANLIITEQNIDTSTSYGEMFMNPRPQKRKVVLGDLNFDEKPIFRQERDQIWL